MSNSKKPIDEREIVAARARTRVTMKKALNQVLSAFPDPAKAKPVNYADLSTDEIIAAVERCMNATPAMRKAFAPWMKPSRVTKDITLN